MSMNHKVLSRSFHLLASMALGLFIYSPWKDNATFYLIMSYGIFPVLAFTGLWMWQFPRLKKLFKVNRTFSPYLTRTK